MYDFCETNLCLAQNKKSDYCIVIAKNASEPVRFAAQELSYFLHELCGAWLAVRTDDTPFSEKEIILGLNAHTLKADPDASADDLGTEGFRLKTCKNTVLILGSDQRGTLYGVYTLLENYFGCRFYAPDFTKIPAKDTLTLPALDDRQVPVLEYRSPYHCFYFGAEWNVRNKCNGHQANLESKHGGKMSYCKYFVHSFNNLVPVEKYFDTHPEYFSEVDGKRVRENTQLCLTNPDVLRICLEEIRSWIAENPDATIVTVSVNDCYNPCTCPECRKVYEREGSHAGVLIEFVNKIAEEIGKDYPHILIDTLSYLFTRKAPLHVKAHPNVIIRLCTIECCFAHPLSECREKGSMNLISSARADFASDLRDWSRCCQRLYIWDYMTNFENYLQPVPNFKVQQPNLKFYIENGVKGVFSEGYTINGNNRSAELDHVRMYLLAKLMWNPDADADRIVNEYFAAYYESAAPLIREYYDLIHAQVVDRSVHLGVYDPPTKPYLNNVMLDRAERIFDEAERVADSETVLARVRALRMSVTFVRLYKTPVGMPGREERVDALYDDVRDHGMMFVTEHYPLEVCRERMHKGQIHLHNQ